MPKRYTERQCPSCNQHKTMHQLSLMCVSCRIDEERGIGVSPKGMAWKAMNKALRSGELERRPCEVCAHPKSDGHHDDYAKPLEVRWLCRSCHKLHHSKFGPGKNAA